MGKFSHPHRGSLQFVPRRRAASEVARIRTWVAPDGKAVLGFAGYKAAIAHAHLIENNPKSVLVNQSRQTAVTVVRAPPLKAAGIRFYLSGKPAGQLMAGGKGGAKTPERFDDVRLLLSAQPKLAGIGKKKPELLEIALAGTPDEQRKTAEGLLGKEIRAADALTVGDYIDVFAVTKGRGFLGPVARHGVPLQSPKTKNSRRRPGNIGSWRPKRTLWQTPMGGKTGYNQRCEYNSRVLMISDKFPGVAGDTILISGSVPGPAKRFLRFRFAVKPPRNVLEPQRVESVSVGEVGRQ